METAAIHKILSIIPTYNGKGCIYKCIESLVKSSIKNNILIIDNASTDNTVQIINESFKGLIIKENSENLGFGRAINLGFKYGLESGYDYFLILNQDGELESDTILQLTNFAKGLKPDDWGFISPWNKDSEGNTEHYFEDNLNKRSGRHAQTIIGHYKVIPVDFINAACWLVNPKVIEKLKGFDKRFFMYGEDFDFCNRARYFGYKMYVLPEIVCFHHKLKGDYDDKNKKLEVSLGAFMAFFLNPNERVFSKIEKYCRLHISYVKLILTGRFIEGIGLIFGVNKIILKLIFYNGEIDNFDKREI